MKILFLSHSRRGPYFRVGSHHLAREFGQMGHNVVHLSTPGSKIHKLRDLFRKQRSSELLPSQGNEPGVTHASYETFLPIAWMRGKRAFENALKRYQIDRPDLVLIDQPLMDFVGLFPNSIVIYRPTDIHPSGVKRRRELRIVPAVDAVVATSKVVLDSLPGVEDKPTMILENGVEVGLFLIGDRKTRRTGAVYVGAVDHRIDWDAINEVAKYLEPESVTVVGPLPPKIPDVAANVVLQGPAPYDEIPQLIAKSRIGLLPFNGHDLNSSRSPMKFYEYLAAGLYVVGKSTEPLRARGAPGVFLYNAVHEIGSLVAQVPPSQEGNIPGQTFSMSFDWSRRADELMRFASPGGEEM